MLLISLLEIHQHAFLYMDLNTSNVINKRKKYNTGRRVVTNLNTSNVINKLFKIFIYQH